MNVRASVGLLAATVISVVALAYAADQNVAEDLSQVQLPANSCSITCPTGTTWRGKPVGGGGVTCGVDFAPVCQCLNDSKPIAGCEALRKSR